MLQILCTKSSDSVEDVHPVIHSVSIICSTCHRKTIYYKYVREFDGKNCPKKCAFCEHVFPPVSPMLHDNDNLALEHKLAFSIGG